MDKATCPNTQAALATTWSHAETYDVHGVNSLTVHHNIHLTIVLAAVTMAPVALDANPSYIPLAFAISYASAVVFFSSIIGLGLYRSHKDLGPAQDTRHRVSQRRKLTTAFASLAALSFALALGSGISYLTLSYSVWASERGIEVLGILGNSSSDTFNSTGFHLARWLSDTPVFLDAHEIIAEQPRRVWWGQQLDLASISWMMLLSIEGRRRQIPFLWAYAALSQLVSLSFAQNLFYIAMLLTPSAASAQELRTSHIFSRFFPPKPTNWFIKPSLYLAALTINYAAVALLPYAAGTEWFPAMIGLAKGFQFMPLVLPAIVPISWGNVSSIPHGSYQSINKIFKVLSYASGFAHAKSTLTGIYYNLPEAYKHRHSIKIPFDTEKRSTWERSASAAEKILGAMGDHPVVMALGRDVLLSALSLGLWAAVRAMNVGDIVEVATPFKTKLSEKQATQMFSAVSDRDESPNSITRLPRLASRERRRSAGLRYAVLDGPGGLSEDKDLSTPTPATRKRGRPRKNKAEPKPDPEEVPGDETYEPTPAEQASAVGDVVPDDDFDWESAALAWGLTAFGGLGMGSSAVFGAECVSR